MSPERLAWLLPRVRRFYRYSPWLIDRWLEEIAAECDDAQWAKLCRLMGWH